MMDDVGFPEEDDETFDIYDALGLNTPVGDAHEAQVAYDPLAAFMDDDDEDESLLTAPTPGFQTSSRERGVPTGYPRPGPSGPRNPSVDLERWSPRDVQPQGGARQRRIPPLLDHRHGRPSNQALCHRFGCGKQMETVVTSKRPACPLETGVRFVVQGTYRGTRSTRTTVKHLKADEARLATPS